MPQTYDLFVTELASGKTRLLVEALPHGNVGVSTSWAPDGARLAYTTAGPEAGEDCYVVGVTDGRTRRLSTDALRGFARHHRGPLWAPDGSFLLEAANGGLWRLPVDGQGPVPLARWIGWRIDDVVPHGRTGRFWQPRTGRVVVHAIERATLRAAFVEVDLGGGGRRELYTDDEAHGRLAIRSDVSEDGGRLAFFRVAAHRPPDLWVADTALTGLRRVSRLRPALDSAALGRARLLRWRSGANELAGALLLPPARRPGRRSPLVVDVYGGATRSRMLHDFGPRKLLTSRGYAVLLPDAPLGVGRPMRDLLAAVMPGIDRAVELGIADPDRLAVLGQSYGGYGALSLIVQTERFRAAVCNAGFGDMVARYATMREDGTSFAAEWCETGLMRMGGTPWNQRERYLANSPLLQLDRIATPVLLLHGTADVAVPAFLADQIFVGLRRLGKTVEYARYRGEAHATSAWSMPNRIDAWRRTISWLDRHVRGSAAGK